MTEVSATERFFDFEVTGNFGKAWQYGERIYGQVSYGEEEIKMDTGVGAPLDRWGIYQIRHEQGRRFVVREKFYIPSNPQSGPQQAWRTTFTNGMAAWATLTESQKKEYHKKASKIGLHGVNLFMRKYLNSH